MARRLWMSGDKLLKLPAPPVDGGMPTVVLVGQLHRGSFEAVCFARSVASDLVAVHKDRNRFCMEVLPVFVTQHRWENLLHNQSTILLRQALREQGTRVVTTVGFYL